MPIFLGISGERGRDRHALLLTLSRVHAVCGTSKRLKVPVSIAWLRPCAIDVAIAQATLRLLLLSRHRFWVESVYAAAAARAPRPRAAQLPVHGDRWRTVASPTPSSPRTKSVAAAQERRAALLDRHSREIRNHEDVELGLRLVLNTSWDEGALSALRCGQPLSELRRIK